MLTLSIIIPTYNRGDLLMRGVKELAIQCSGVDAQIIVIDDGSVDDSPGLVERWAAESRMPVHVIRQEHRGPATARNRGLDCAAGHLVLFMGDDIFPAPGLVHAHLAHHQRFPSPEVAVLGRVTWSPDLRITPLMQWLEHGGPQFCYDRIADPLAVPPTFFWTANVSAKTAFVRGAGGFSPRFPDAAFEDVELGVRLARSGMALHYAPEALGYHHHAVSLLRSLARMETLAQGALIANDTMPGLISLGHDTRWGRARRALAHDRRILALLRALAPVCTAVPACRATYFRLVHDLHYRAAIRRRVREV